jgi:hypothetical protein
MPEVKIKAIRSRMEEKGEGSRMKLVRVTLQRMGIEVGF